MRPFVTLLALLATAPALAQPGALTVTPDTLYWTWATSYLTPFEIRNVGADSLRLDSIDIGPCSWEGCDDFGPGYSVRLEHAGASNYGFIWHTAFEDVVQWDTGGRFPDVLLAPGDTAAFFVTGMDPCPICFGGQPDTWAPVLFWAGGHPAPVGRTLAYAYPVAAEPGAEAAGVELSVGGSNPSAGGTTLRLRLDEASEVDLALYDALGRRVRTLVAGALAAGAHPVEVGGEGLRAGLYFARAVVGTRRGAVVVTRRLVLSR